jgi:hypothetical protein
MQDERRARESFSRILGMLFNLDIGRQLRDRSTPRIGVICACLNLSGKTPRENCRLVT